MKIHTDLDAETVTKLARDAVPSIDVHLDTHGSRKRTHRHDVVLTDNGRSLPGRRQSAATVANGAKGITYDEWGLFITAIYELDPEAIVGPYAGRDDFHYTTDWRFTDLRWKDRCNRHRWEFLSGWEHECKKCGAIRRRSPSGFTA